MNIYILGKDASTEPYEALLLDAVKNGRADIEKITYVEIGFVCQYLEGVDASTKTEDQIVPSHIASHVLAKIIIEMIQKEGLGWRLIEFPSFMELPYEVDLQEGIRAISYINEDCPEDCVEDGPCPVKGESLKWDIGKALEKYAKENVVAFVGFECSHFVNNVSSVPMKDVVHGWLGIKEMISWGDPFKVIIATHSKCHGIAALIEVGPNNEGPLY